MTQDYNLFDYIIQPPPLLKKLWRQMIPEWAWGAMIQDTYLLLKREYERNSPKEDIERSIRNKFVFIRREAFFPDCFLPDVFKEANDIIKREKSKYN